jgi:hypothetical protein
MPKRTLARLVATLVAVVAALPRLPALPQDPAARAEAPSPLERLAAGLARQEQELSALLERLSELDADAEDDALACGAFVEELHAAARSTTPLPELPSVAELSALRQKRAEAFAQERNRALLEGVLVARLADRAQAWVAMAATAIPSRTATDGLYRYQSRFTTGRRIEEKTAAEAIGVSAVDLVRVTELLLERSSSPLPSGAGTPDASETLCFERLDACSAALQGAKDTLERTVQGDESLQLELVVASAGALQAALDPWRPAGASEEDEALEGHSLQQALITVVAAAADLDRSLRALTAMWGSEVLRKPLPPIVDAAAPAAGPKPASHRRDAKAVDPLHGWTVGTAFEGTRDGRNKPSDPPLVVTMRGSITSTSEGLLVLDLVESWHEEGKAPVPATKARWAFRVGATDDRRGRTKLECTEQSHAKGAFTSVRGDAVLTASTLSGEYYHEYTLKGVLQRPFGLREFELTRLPHPSFAAGSQWTGADGRDPAWTVHSIAGSRLMLDMPSIQKKGVVRFTLDVASDGAIDVIDIKHVGTPHRVDSRNSRGSGTFENGRIVFRFETELKPAGRGWEPWAVDEVVLVPKRK